MLVGHICIYREELTLELVHVFSIHKRVRLFNSLIFVLSKLFITLIRETFFNQYVRYWSYKYFKLKCNRIRPLQIMETVHEYSQPLSLSHAHAHHPAGPSRTCAITTSFPLIPCRYPEKKLLNFAPFLGQMCIHIYMPFKYIFCHSNLNIHFFNR